MELQGSIIKLINSNYGYILGEDQQLYLFCITNILDPIENKDLLNKQVLFKPVQENILQAILISLK